MKFSRLWGKDTLYIRISGDVDHNLVESFLDTYHHIIKQPEVPKVSIWFSSNGGLVEAVDQIRKIIQEIDKICNMTLINSSFVGSAAVDIFIAAKNRAMLNGSTFMIHQSHIKVNKGDIYQERELKDCITEVQAANVGLKNFKLNKREKKIVDSGSNLYINTYGGSKRIGLVNRRLV